jgi:hypothetical protein
VAAPTAPHEPRSGGPGGGASEMATGVVVGSAMMLAPASPPAVAPPSIECLESEGRRQTPSPIKLLAPPVRFREGCWGQGTGSNP